MKEKFIEIYDDIIPIELQDYLISITLNKSPNLSSQDDAFLLFFNEGATTPEGKVDDYDFIFANSARTLVALRLSPKLYRFATPLIRIVTNPVS